MVDRPVLLGHGTYVEGHLFGMYVLMSGPEVILIGVVLLDHGACAVSDEQVDGGEPFGEVVTLECLIHDEVKVVLIEQHWVLPSPLQRQRGRLPLGRSTPHAPKGLAGIYGSDVVISYRLRHRRMMAESRKNFDLSLRDPARLLARQWPSSWGARFRSPGAGWLSGALVSAPCVGRG